MQSQYTINLYFYFILDELNQLFSEYEITHPVVVSAEGEFISNDLQNALFQSHLHSVKRRRRSLGEKILTGPSGSNLNLKFDRAVAMSNDMHIDTSFSRQSSGQTDNFDRMNSIKSRRESFLRRSFSRHHVNFNVTAFGSQLQLQVEIKSKLIAPGAKSIRFTSNGRRIEKNLESGCYFFGKISRQPLSKVAISNCKGLVS